MLFLWITNYFALFSRKINSGLFLIPVDDHPAVA